MVRYIAQEWDNLATKMLTIAMSQEERDQRKIMFFAGAIAAVSLLNDHGTPNLRRLIEMSNELLEWRETMQRIEKRSDENWEGKPMPPVTVDVMRQIEQHARAAFGALDFACDNIFQRRELGAALFVFSFHGPELTYISNADRGTMMKMLKEFVEANPPAMTWDEQHG